MAKQRSNAATVGAHGTLVEPDLSYIIEPLRRLAVPIIDLKPDPANARLHPEDNLDAIVKSLKQFGQDQPLVVQKQGMIVRKGNGRLEAAKRLGWEYIAAVVVDEDNIDAAARAVADNRSAELAQWDERVLLSTMQAWQSARPDAKPTDLGFRQDVLEAMAARLRQHEADNATMPAPGEPSAPDAFPSFDENIKTDFQCPKCAFVWSGKPKPGAT